MKKYTFPTYWVVIEANSPEEAEKILHEQLSGGKKMIDTDKISNKGTVKRASNK